MMRYTDDPAADYSAYCEEIEERAKHKPICTECENPIMDEDAYMIHGKLMCSACVEDSRIYI